MQRKLLQTIMQYPDYWVEVVANDGDVYVRPCDTMQSARIKAGLMRTEVIRKGYLEIRDCIKRKFYFIYSKKKDVWVTNRIKEINARSWDDEA